ncbi:hypothetical protein BDB00DRAFT_387457 [Zychaea mexicana]|uniref:uncharacterized protein n=1 Tax=Zychaea mexicana TaxID=64656 RepID=UPI0022FF3687|nr:uncharacterized protein BDB00DRAFT_387457 [Zychaea mexicana]KAI9493159.1 hypothetical protein BDB00DRAFT_387457 [Zychaea mexicana]
MNGFYSLSMQVASDARKTGLMKQTRETQYSLQPALSPQLSSQKHQQQIQAHEDVPYQRERSRYSDWSLSELEDERKRILQQFQCQVGHDPDKLGQIIVTVAMSVDSPKENGNQLGGYGVVWFHEGFPNQVGYYDGPFNGTSIFILLAMRDALVASRPDRPLLIGMKHQAVYNCKVF